MANELIPPQIANGGTGSPEVGNVRAPDYRQLEAPEQVNTDLPNSEAAFRAHELEGVFKQFEGVSGDIYNKAQTQAGALAGAASGATGHPQYRQGLARFTAYSQAFNNAATGAYAIEAEAQADDSAARLRVQANKNPATFQTTYSAVRDAVLKNAPPMAVPMLTELYNKHLAAGLAAISGDQAAEHRDLQAKAYSYGVDKQVSRVATLLSSNNPQDHLAAQDEQVKLNLQIEGGFNAGLYSRASADAMHVNAMRSVMEQTFATRVDSDLADPGGKVVATMERFREAYIQNQASPNEPSLMSHPEYDRQMSEAKQKVQQQRMMDYYDKAQGKTAEQLKYEAGDRDMTNRLITGTLTLGVLGNAERNMDVTPEVARTLRAQLMAGPVTHTDPKAYLAAASDPNHLDWSPDEIAALPGITNADKIKLGTQFEHERRDWQGTPEAKQARDAILAALKIRPGMNRAMMSEEQRSASDDALQELTARMNALDPAQRKAAALSVAQDVVHSIKQKDVQGQITELEQLKRNAMQDFGPGSPAALSKAQMDAYLKKKDDAIAALRQQLSK